MKIKVLSRIEFEKSNFKEPFIAISITDPNSEPVMVGQLKYIEKILSLQFHDIDKPLRKRQDCKLCDGTGKSKFFHDTDNCHCSMCTDNNDLKIFDESYAEKILEFVSTYALDVDLIVVHCEAGISRSAGTASALSLIYNGEDQYYFDNYLPNMLVYRKIINVAVKKGFFHS